MGKKDAFQELIDSLNIDMQNPDAVGSNTPSAPYPNSTDVHSSPIPHTPNQPHGPNTPPQIHSSPYVQAGQNFLNHYSSVSQTDSGSRQYYTQQPPSSSAPSYNRPFAYQNPSVDKSGQNTRSQPTIQNNVTFHFRETPTTVSSENQSTVSTVDTQSPPASLQFRTDKKNDQMVRNVHKPFHLQIDSEEYTNIPDPPPTHSKTNSWDTAKKSGGSGIPPRDPKSSSGSLGESPKKPHKKKKRIKRTLRTFKALLISLALVVFAIGLSYFALVTAGDMLGMNKDDVEAEIVIEENQTVAQVAQELKKAGIITQPLVFELYAKIMGKDTYEPGKYSVNSKMAYSQIMNRFENGVVEMETVRIMFPEGQTIIQIAQTLEDNNVCSADEFLKMTDTGSFGYEFENMIPDNPLRFHRMEGYIFPETYEFYVGEKVESVIDKFLDVFNKRVTQDLYELMDQRGLTLDQTITLASIIQKETGNQEYMYKVSSVFHNRLNSQSLPRLESDATTDYIEKQIKPNLEVENQEMLDAYDTRVCTGLPVGPINNPGLEAIKAALAPIETDYYFFLSDQKGEYYFSQTYDQHLAYLKSAGEAHGTSIERTS